MSEFHTWVILLINQLGDFGEKQLSGFGSRGGQLCPLMHDALWVFQLVSVAKQVDFKLDGSQTSKTGKTTIPDYSLNVPMPAISNLRFSFCFIWFFTSQSTIFQLCRNGSSWVEPPLSKDKCVLLKDTTQWRWWCSNPQPLDLKSSTLLLSHCAA